jgi:hypothetical protein
VEEVEGAVETGVSEGFPAEVDTVGGLWDERDVSSVMSIKLPK